jgi:hypothetical protein
MFNGSPRRHPIGYVISGLGRTIIAVDALALFCNYQQRKNSEVIGDKVELLCNLNAGIRN